MMVLLVERDDGDGYGDNLKNGTKGGACASGDGDSGNGGGCYGDGDGDGDF